MVVFETSLKKKLNFIKIYLAVHHLNNLDAFFSVLKVLALKSCLGNIFVSCLVSLSALISFRSDFLEGEMQHIHLLSEFD